MSYIGSCCVDCCVRDDEEGCLFVLYRVMMTVRFWAVGSMIDYGIDQ